MSIKLLSNREMELFKLGINYATRLNRCQPDVGMGCTREMLAREVAGQLPFRIDEDDIHRVCKNTVDT